MEARHEVERIASVYRGYAVEGVGQRRLAESRVRRSDDTKSLGQQIQVLGQQSLPHELRVSRVIFDVKNADGTVPKVKLSRSERPVILAGSGIRLAGAERELTKALAIQQNQSDPFMNALMPAPSIRSVATRRA